MITMKQYHIIRKAKDQGFSISAIAVKLGRDSKAVRKCYRMEKDELAAYLERMAEKGEGLCPLSRRNPPDLRRSPRSASLLSRDLRLSPRETLGLPGTERTLRNYLAYLKASGGGHERRRRSLKGKPGVSLLPYCEDYAVVSAVGYTYLHGRETRKRKSGRALPPSVG